MAAEADLERRARLIVRSSGGRLVKWVSPGTTGVPDRLLLFPWRPVVFIEFKAPGGQLRPAQKSWQRWLRASGFEHWVIDDLDDFTRRFNEWKA